MLKFISKSIFVSVLCGSLMLMDFSSKGLMLNAARAESVKTDKISDSDLMGTLTMTVVGTLATRLYTYKMTTDIMLAAAGGALFIGGEVLAYFKLKEVMKEMEVQITRDKKGNVNKEQIEALERLKKSYEEAKKTAQTKKTLQMAAAAAFAAAGVMAYTMSGVEMAQLTACTAPIPAVIAAATASAAACTVGGCSAPFIACAKSATALSLAITKYELARQAMGPSAALLAAFTAENAAITLQSAAMATICSASGGPAVGAACGNKFTVDLFQASGGAGLGVVHSNPFIKKLINEESRIQKIAVIPETNKFHNFINQALNLFFPKAEAALFSAMGIASSAAIAYLMTTSATLGPTVDMFMLNPRNRAMVWGVLAGLTFAATSATDNVIKQIESNISKIDGILNSMYQMANGTESTLANNPAKVQTTLKPNQRLEFNETDYGEVDISKGENGALPCYTGNNPSKCKSLQDSVKDTESFNNLNLESQKQLSSILSTANGLNGTSKISGATLKGAASLAGSANALRSAYDKAAKKSAEDLKKAGSKFNIDEQTKKLSGMMDKNVRDAIKKANSTPAGMLATMYSGRGAMGSGSSTATTANTDDKALEAALKSPVAPGGNVIDLGNGAAGEKSDLGLTGMDSESVKELSAEELAKINESQKAAAGSTIDDYEIKNDITNDTSSSIFELISNRYQKSGYPRLFKIKEPAAAPVPVKN